MIQRLRICTVLILGIAFLSFCASNTSGQSVSYTDLQPDQFMKQWLVLGPIAAEPGDGAPADAAARDYLFQADLLQDGGGEAAIEPIDSAAVEVNGNQQRWKFFASDSDIVDLQQVLGEREWVTAYAAAEINSATQTKALLGIGSDDAIRVWLNGELIHDHWIGRPTRPDNDIVAVNLTPGKNRLLLKVVNQQGDWSFSCRLLSGEKQAERLVTACSRGDAEAIETLIAAGVDVNAKSKYGVTAYQTAKIRGHEHVAELLESRGADPSLEVPAPNEYLDSLLQARIAEDGPGVCVLVSRGGELLYSKAVGLANVEHEVPISTNTKFRIGSVTKQFTAAAILKLQEEGKLSVHDHLSKFIPDFPRGDEVTIHHLLTHTSGIQSFTEKPGFFKTVTMGTTPEELIESFKHDPYNFSPGEKWSYNNSGYFLLGYIIEKVTDKPYADYLRETFFEPLGMSDTGFHTPTAILKHEATGYSNVNGNTEKALDWDMSQAGAAGALYSTVNDLQRWNEALFGGEVLSEESLQAAFTPVETDQSGDTTAYGYGWAIDETRGLQRISHGGGLHGFLSFLARYPDQDATIAVLHNASPPAPGANPAELAELFAETFLWQEMSPRPRYVANTDVDPKVYDDYVGRYDYGAAILNVTKEEDHLFAQLTGQPKIEIFPLTETKFFWKVVDAQVEFLCNEDGTVTAAQHTQGGRTFKAPKMEAQETAVVSEELLDKYVGKYEYKGLGTLTVRRDGDQLLAQMTGQPEYPIFPKSETEFYWKVVQAEIQFVEGGDDKVQKAIHTQGGGKIEAAKIE